MYRASLKATATNGRRSCNSGSGRACEVLEELLRIDRNERAVSREGQART
ncbi:MAG: hypothetical protein ACE5EX_00510 [Phycisphaerae bacterium]